MNGKKLLIIGAGGHGKVVADIAKNCGYENIAFLDDGKTGFIGECEIIGKISDAEKYIGDWDFAVAIGNGEIRKKVSEELEEKGASLATLIHPFTAIASEVSFGKGTVVMAGAVINSGTTIEKGVIINTCASVDHDCSIGEYSHVAVGAHICGTVNIGKNCWIGAGSTVINNIDICDDCFIGAGAVVIRNIDEPGKYIGIPAKKID